MIRALRFLGAALVWAALAAAGWLVVFTHSSAHTVVASHDATVTPTLDGYATVEMGPYFPDLRMDSGGRIGVHIIVGKSNATDTADLVTRYAAIGSRPEAEVDQMHRLVRELAISAALRAGVMALLPLLVWFALGARRRRLLLRPRALAVAGTALLLVAVAAWEPWRDDPEPVVKTSWTPLPEAVPEIPMPAELSIIQVQSGAVTASTRRLVQSAVDTYTKSVAFYGQVAEKVPAATGIREPKKGERVAVLVSDRHDNIGMDKVARAIGDAGGATAVIDAGDDTSTGQPWEGFSLDSLAEAFKKYDDRIFIAGNHDHGGFVSQHLASAGWTHLKGKPVRAIDGVRLFGVDDPRSSGLGSWRDEKGLSFDEIKGRLSDEVCRLDDAGDRVATVVVHDANLAMPALEKGCTDLVLGGHLHVQVGPDRIVGSNDKIGYRYTNGTTGGAAYAFALGSKLRREAEVTLVTFKDGRPTGIQPVRITTPGEVVVDRWVALTR